MRLAGRLERGADLVMERPGEVGLDDADDAIDGDLVGRELLRPGQYCAHAAALGRRVIGVVELAGETTAPHHIDDASAAALRGHPAGGLARGAKLSRQLGGENTVPL